MSLEEDFRAHVEACARRGARFPNSAGLRRFWREGRALSERLARSTKKRFFSEYGDYFSGAARSLTRSARADVEFLRFGWSRPSLELLDAHAAFGRTNSLVATSDSGRQVVALLPTRTALILLLAQLGYDLEAFCRDRSVWRDFESATREDAVMTSLECATFERLRRRFAILTPAITLSEIVYDDLETEEEWRVDFIPNDTERVARILGRDDYYFEESSIVVGKRKFPWTTMYPMKDLLGASDGDVTREKNAERDTTEYEARDRATKRPAAPSHEDRTSAPSSDATDGKRRLDVVVARGTMPIAAWRALKPGDVLTTSAPSEQLFDVVLDGKVILRGRPGIYRGAHAIQIQELVDSMSDSPEKLKK